MNDDECAALARALCTRFPDDHPYELDDDELRARIRFISGHEPTALRLLLVAHDWARLWQPPPQQQQS